MQDGSDVIVSNFGPCKEKMYHYYVFAKLVTIKIKRSISYTHPITISKITFFQKCCNLYTIKDSPTDRPYHCTFQDYPNYPMANLRFSRIRSENFRSVFREYISK